MSSARRQTHGEAARPSRSGASARAYPKEARYRDDDGGDAFHRIRQQHLLQLSADAPRAADASWQHVVAVQVAVAPVPACSEDADDCDWRDWSCSAEADAIIEAAHRCPICLSAPVAARMLSCGHVYCFACLFQVVRDDSVRRGGRSLAVPDLARALVGVDACGPAAATDSRTIMRCPVCADSVNACDSRPVTFRSPLHRRQDVAGGAQLLPACAYPALLSRAHDVVPHLTCHPVPAGAWAAAASSLRVPVCMHMGAPTHVYSSAKHDVMTTLSRFYLSAVHVSSLTPGTTHLPEYIAAPAGLPSGVRVHDCVHARADAQPLRLAQLRLVTAAALRAAAATHRDEEEHTSAAVTHAIRDSSTPLVRTLSAPASPPLAAMGGRPSSGWSRTHTHALIKAHTPVAPAAAPALTSSLSAGVAVSAASEAIGNFSDATAHARASALACEVAASVIESAAPVNRSGSAASCDCTRVLVYACQCGCAALDAHAMAGVTAAAVGEDGSIDAARLPLVLLAPVVASAPMRTRALTHCHAYTTECDARRVLTPGGALVPMNAARAGVLDCSRGRGRVRQQLTAAPREARRSGVDASQDARARTQSDVLREFMGIHSEVDASSLRLCADAGDVSDLAAFPAMSSTTGGTPVAAAAALVMPHSSHTHTGWRYKDVVHAPLGYTPSLSEARNGSKSTRIMSASAAPVSGLDAASSEASDAVVGTSPPSHVLDLSAMLRAAPAGRAGKQKKGKR